MLIAEIQNEGRTIQKNPLLCRDSTISRIWSNMCKDEFVTIEVNFEEFRENTKLVWKISKLIGRIVLKKEITEDDLSAETSICNLGIAMFEQFKEICVARGIKLEASDIIYQVACIFAVMILIVEIDISSKPIKLYWESVGIIDDCEKVAYIVEKLTYIILDGMLPEMARIAIFQTISSDTLSRGLIFDCFHLMHSPFVDYVFTADNHFLLLSGFQPGLYGNIVDVDNLRILPRIVGPKINA